MLSMVLCSSSSVLSRDEKQLPEIFEPLLSRFLVGAEVEPVRVADRTQGIPVEEQLIFLLPRARQVREGGALRAPVQRL